MITWRELPDGRSYVTDPNGARIEFWLERYSDGWRLTATKTGTEYYCSTRTGAMTRARELLSRGW